MQPETKRCYKTGRPYTRPDVSSIIYIFVVVIELCNCQVSRDTIMCNVTLRDLLGGGGGHLIQPIHNLTCRTKHGKWKDKKLTFVFFYPP